MPKEVDTEALDKAKILDIGKPPMREIPHQEFPRCMYLYPKEPFKTVRQRNAVGEVVNEFKEATQAKTKNVNNEAELKEALKQGWKKEAYMPAVLTDEDEYGEPVK